MMRCLVNESVFQLHTLLSFLNLPRGHRMEERELASRFTRKMLFGSNFDAHTRKKISTVKKPDILKYLPPYFKIGKNCFPIQDFVFPPVLC